MAYDFKKLSDVNTVETMKDSLNVLVDNGGEIVKIAAPKITYDAFETTTTNEITWDGVVGDRVTLFDGLFVHITDYVPDISAFAQGCTLDAGAAGRTEYTADDVSSIGEDIYAISEVAFVACVDGASFIESEETIAFPKKGVYFINIGIETGQTVPMVLTSPLLSVSTTKIKKSALPDDIGGGGDSQIVVVGIDMETMKLNKTPAEIATLQSAGKLVLFSYTAGPIYISANGPDEIVGAYAKASSISYMGDPDDQGYRSALCANQIYEFDADGTLIGMYVNTSDETGYESMM